MSMFWWLELQPGWEWFGDMTAILWIGFSMSLVAWMKVWMVSRQTNCGLKDPAADYLLQGSPSFNTACSMTTILIFVV